MAFADDLLEQASHLARREKRKPKQASLRRAVSSSYYAVFHLLTSEAVANWRTIRQRASLARSFEHGKMRSACERVLRAPFAGRNLNSVANLKMVAKSFIQLQQQRHTADYDNSKTWSRTEVLGQVSLATAAFKGWHAIRTEEIAQDYLLWFLVNRP